MQLELSSEMINTALKADISDVEAIPKELTEEIYAKIMGEFDVMVQEKVQMYQGEVPIAPVDLVVMLTRVYDELKTKYGFSEFELASAGQVYQTLSLTDLKQRLHTTVSKITLSKPVKAG